MDSASESRYNAWVHWPNSSQALMDALPQANMKQNEQTHSFRNDDKHRNWVIPKQRQQETGSKMASHM